MWVANGAPVWLMMAIWALRVEACKESLRLGECGAVACIEMTVLGGGNWPRGESESLRWRVSRKTMVIVPIAREDAAFVGRW